MSNSEYHHYLLARHSDNYYGDKIHNFILHNIKSIEILDLTYLLPDEFSLRDYCHDMFGTFKEPPFDVEWLFDKLVANDIFRLDKLNKKEVIFASSKFIK